ncbi:uncharacterized protein BROUX77_006674 [Berkeleyomyces rouxiae]|uniref:uncharacterized protein n=1 Tax=Berkeleyomyces rouxiae TaxID=2035830 RepID=UPI003B781059
MLSSSVVFAALAGLVPAAAALESQAFQTAMAAHIVRSNVAPTPRPVMEKRDIGLAEMLSRDSWVPSTCHDQIAFMTEAPSPQGALGEYEDSGVDPCLNSVPSSLSRDYLLYSSSVLSWVFAHGDQIQELYTCLGSVRGEVTSSTYCDAIEPSTMGTGTAATVTQDSSAASSTGSASSSSAESGAGRVFTGPYAMAIAGILAAAVAL